jgi:hypothetical protein
MRSDGHVPGALDEISKPVVVAQLRAGRGRGHGMIIGLSLTPLNSSRTSRAAAHVRQAAAVTTTRAGRCRMSVETAPLGGPAMTIPTSVAALLERFFTQRLMQQRQASPHTISSYRDTFRQFLKFVQQRVHKLPSRLHFEEIDAPLLERTRLTSLWLLPYSC